MQITGMLLGYSNGTWTSLGGIDPDKLESAKHVDTPRLGFNLPTLGSWFGLV